MNNQHSIVPSFALRNQWQSESPFKIISVDREDYMINRAAQWGADQELEACCKWLSNRSSLTEILRTERRPKPPSLRKQALDVLKHKRVTIAFNSEEHDIILRALEALPND